MSAVLALNADTPVAKAKWDTATNVASVTQPLKAQYKLSKIFDNWYLSY